MSETSPSLPHHATTTNTTTADLVAIGRPDTPARADGAADRDVVDLSLRVPVEDSAAAVRFRGVMLRNGIAVASCTGEILSDRVVVIEVLGMSQRDTDRCTVATLDSLPGSVCRPVSVETGATGPSILSYLLAEGFLPAR